MVPERLRRAGQRRWSERSEGLEKAELERGVRCQSVPCFGGLKVNKSTLRGKNQHQGHGLTVWHKVYFFNRVEKSVTKSGHVFSRWSQALNLDSVRGDEIPSGRSGVDGVDL